MIDYENPTDSHHYYLSLTSFDFCKSLIAACSQGIPVILFGILGSYLFLHIWENILIKLGK